MQSYTEIVGTSTVKDSRALLLSNDKSIMSCFSGTAFPSANLQVGMLCLRTDENVLYQLKDATPTWMPIANLGTQAALVGRGTLGGSVDLNSITFPGLYVQDMSANAASGTNYPAPYAGSLQVTSSANGGMIWQVYHVYADYPRLYIRAKYSTTWNAWRLLAFSDEVVAKDQPAFSGNPNTVTTTTSNTLCTFGNAFSRGITVTSNRLTIQVAGAYYVYFHQLVSTASTTLYLEIRKNGVVDAYAYSNNDDTYDVIISRLMYLNVGDYIEFRYGGTVTYAWGTPHASISMHMIG